jgi:hypothetical protein
LAGVFCLAIILLIITSNETSIESNESFAQSEKLKLYLKVQQDIWVIVVCDSDTVLSRMLSAGAERQWEAEDGFIFSVSNSSAIELKINDHRAAPLADTARIISGLEINQENYRSFLLSNDENKTETEEKKLSKTDL